MGISQKICTIFFEKKSMAEFLGKSMEGFLEEFFSSGGVVRDFPMKTL